MNRRNGLRPGSRAARLQDLMERECADISDVQVPADILRVCAERKRKAELAMAHHDARLEARLK